MTNRIVLRLNFAKMAALAVAGMAALAAPMVVGILTAPPIRAQAAAPAPPKFEVASVKPGTGCGDGGGRGGKSGGGAGLSPGRLDLPCRTVMELIELAYVSATRMAAAVPMPLKSVPISGGPAWINSDRYDIDAKAEGAPGQKTMRGPMLQALLEDRCKLKIHRETKEVPVYALTVAKGGPKLLQAAQEGRCMTLDPNLPPPPRPWTLPRCGIFIRSRTKEGSDIYGVTMADLCRQFSSLMDRNVIDRTGITGTFDIFVPAERSPGSPADPMPGLSAPAAPATPAAPAFSLPFFLVEKLGLKLQPAKGPGESLVIDHVERPSEN